MAFREYSVTERAVSRAASLGLAGDVAQELARMARFSAPFTHPGGNRRYEGWWLKIEKDQVVAVGLIEPGPREWIDAMDDADADVAAGHTVDSATVMRGLENLTK